MAAVCLAVLHCALWLRRGATTRQIFSLRADRLAAEFAAARPAVADADNAAPLYRQAFDAMVEESEIEGVCKEGSADLQVFLGERAARVLAANRRSLEILAEATAKPTCDFHPGAPPDAFASADSRFLTATRLIQMAALRESLSGTPDRARDLLLANLRLAPAAEGHGYLHDRLLADMLLRPAVWDIARAVDASDRLNEAIPELLRGIDAVRCRRASLRQVLRNGTILAAVAIDKSFGPRQVGYSTLNPWILSGRYAIDVEECERHFDAWCSEGGKGYLEILDEARALREAAAEDGSGAGFVRRLFYELPERCVYSDGVTEAACDVLKLAVGCRMHRLKFGAYPEGLEYLARRFPEHFREVPLDPFTAKAIRYRKTANGCVVWSVGPDRTDHDGDWSKDISFEMKR